jgi:O-antigen/teichoic acid export membrane protein
MHNTIGKTTLYLSQIAISGILMLSLMPIISQYLTPGELGQFVLAQVYMGVAVGIANFGMLLSYERNFFIFEKSERDSAKLIFSAIIFVSFNLSILLTAVYLFQSEISDLIFSTNVPDNLLFVILMGVSASSLSQYYLTFLKNSGLAKSYIKYTITNSIINFIIAIGFMTQSSLGSMSLAYAWVASNAIMFLSLFFKLGRGMPGSFDPRMIKGMLKISLPLTPRVFFGFMNTQLDKILLGFIGSSSLVGIYHIGQTFAMTIFQFMTGLDRVFQPEVYRKLFSKKHIKGSYEINNYIFPFFYISIFMALILVVLSKDLVSLLLSDEYQSATPVVVILSLYYALLFFGKITGIQLIYAKKTYITTLLMFLGIAINVGLNIPFIIKWGIIGAAWATAISGILMTFVSYYVAQKYAKIAWQWKPIFIIYSLFLIAIALSLIEYSFPMYFYAFLLLKFILILFYIFVGYRLDIISIRKIKKLISN